MQQPVNSQPGIVRFLEKIAGGIADAPAYLSDLSQSLNQDLVDFSRKLQQSTTGTAQIIEEKLTQNTVQHTGAQAAVWLSQPMNLLLVIAGFVGLLWAVRKA